MRQEWRLRVVAASEEEEDGNCFRTKRRRGHQFLAASSVPAAGNSGYLRMRHRVQHSLHAKGDAGQRHHRRRRRRRLRSSWRTTTRMTMQETRERKPVQRPGEHPDAGGTEMRRTETPGDEEWEEEDGNDDGYAGTLSQDPALGPASRSRGRTATHRPSDRGTRGTGTGRSTASSGQTEGQHLIG